MPFFLGMQLTQCQASQGPPKVLEAPPYSKVKFQVGTFLTSGLPLQKSPGTGRIGNPSSYCFLGFHNVCNNETSGDWLIQHAQAAEM